MKTLYEDLRSQKNLFAAWRHVKRSALKSKNTKIKGAAAEFEHSHQTHLRRIADQLRDGRFEFDDVEGVLKDKKARESVNKNPRPIAIGTIKNRVVQRAILQILQPRKVVDKKNVNSKHMPADDARIGQLNLVNKSKYGVGGLMSPYGGVAPAIKLVMQAMKDGSTHYYQSDIKAFFTKIPTTIIVDKVLEETSDAELSKLFSKGLEVNLANKDELKTYAKIFPSGGIGVAQGSSLSAFAGNVLLYDLDHKLNEMGVVAVRYIDDLVILASDGDTLNAAIAYAKSELKSFGFSLYEPSSGSDKASAGSCSNGFKFLGCTLQPNRCVPSKQSMDRLCSEINKTISVSKSSINEYLSNDKRMDSNLSRSSVLHSIGKKIYGWEKSFSFCTSAVEFAALDARIMKVISNYEYWIRRKTKNTPPEILMAVLGVPSTKFLFEIDQTKNKKS